VRITISRKKRGNFARLRGLFQDHGDGLGEGKVHGVRNEVACFGDVETLDGRVVLADEGRAIFSGLDGRVREAPSEGADLRVLKGRSKFIDDKDIVRARCADKGGGEDEGLTKHLGKE